ncbi:MAG: hypothetical protein ACJARI_002186 [Bacteroidia bacterium]
MPESDRFSADTDAAFSKEIFDIGMAEVEAMLQPDSVGNYVWRESVALVCIHSPIPPIWAVNLYG